MLLKPMFQNNSWSTTSDKTTQEIPLPEFSSCYVDFCSEFTNQHAMIS